MVTVNYDKDQHLIYCTISWTNNFDNIIRVLKSYSCKFHQEGQNKFWSIPTLKYSAIIRDLKEICPVKINPDVETKINQILSTSVKNQLTIFTDSRLFNQELLKYPPVKGLPPNEDYQKIDIERAIQRNRYLLDLEMGLGKTYILIGIISHLKYYDNLGRILILTTRSGTYNFYQEILHHSKIFNPSKIVIASKNTKDIFEKDYDIIISDFDTFRLISDYYYKKNSKDNKISTKYRTSRIPIDNWIGNQPACLIIDESHCIGNAKSRRFQTIKLIADKFYYRYLSSGTFADKVEKIYSQLYILDPGLVDYSSYTDWLKKYANIGNRFSPYAVNYFYQDKIRNLVSELQENYSSSRRIKDHLSLPENYIKRVYVTMHKKHEDIYKAFLRHEANQWTDFSVQAILNKFPYLMIALDNPFLLEIHFSKFPEELVNAIKDFKYDYLEKYSILDDILEEEFESIDKIILWAIHPKTMNYLAKRYAKYNPLVIHGDIDIPKGKTKDEYKMDCIQEFKKNPKRKLLIASLSVLNTAVTVTEAKAQVYVERNFTYIDFIQSTKRIHRIGQESVVKTYILLYDYSLDLYMDKVLDSKGELTEKLLSKSILSKEEWENIFRMNTQSKLRF